MDVKAEKEEIGELSLLCQHKKIAEYG